MAETVNKSIVNKNIPNVQSERAVPMAKSATVQKDKIFVISDVEVGAKQKLKKNNTGQAAWTFLLEYFDNSNIHGVRYLGGKERTIWERLFWIAGFMFALLICRNLRENIWGIVSFAENSAPVWQIPFPAITICPVTKTRGTVFNFTDVLWKLYDKTKITELEAFHMNAVSQVCESNLMKGVKYEYGKRTALSKDLIQALTEIMPLFNETFVECKWRNKATDCRSLFTRVITEDGMCYSFNSLSPQDVFHDEGLIPDFKSNSENRLVADWNLEEGYGVEEEPTTYPKRAFAAGPRSGLYVELKGIAKDFDSMCLGPTQGFKILLTTPGEVAQISKRHFRIPFDREVLISIIPKIITTSNELAQYQPQRRSCYFHNERYLRYFKIYTQRNCQLECLMNFTRNRCGCVKFSMPRNENENVCGVASIACMEVAEDELLLKEFSEEMYNAESYRGRSECNCIPACTSISYEAEISQANVDFKTITAKEIADDKILRLLIFFKEAQFKTSIRSDFLANCGGLLGLSFLCAVEIFYFCTVRLVSNIIMQRQKNKKSSSGGPAPEET